MWLGLQAFFSATAFNANIGAWNTARVTTLQSVRATFGRRRALRRTRSAGVQCGAFVVRGAVPPMRTRTSVRAHVQALACTGAHGCIHVYP